LAATICLLALLPVLALAAPPGERPANAREPVVHPGVWDALAAGRQADVLVILRGRPDLYTAAARADKEARGAYVYGTLWRAAREAQRSLRAELDAAGVAYHPFYIVNALQLGADEALVQAMARRPEVERIVPNTPVPGIPPGESFHGVTARQGVQPNLVRIGADRAWALDYTGQGAVVAGQDTGYDWDHPALVAAYRGWDGAATAHDYNWHDAIHENNPNTAPGNPCGFDSPEPCDDHGHGTHTMGIAVGDDGAGDQIGVAPGARWIGCRNMEQGWGTPATYLECFEFFLAPYPVGGTPAEGLPALAPHVVNNSWSCPPAEGCDPAAIDLLGQAVDALRMAGIAVVVSAGNHGSACGTVLRPPAIYPGAFAVGAFDHRTDTIAAFSSRGPATYDGQTYIKPDLAAPGVSIRSSFPGGGYVSLSGTSMAAPHVAGGVAILLSAAPAYAGDVDAIEAELAAAAEPMTTSQGCGGDGPGDVPNNVWGWGVLDVISAVETIPVGLVRGTVTDVENGRPLAGAQVVADVAEWPEAGGDGRADLSGVYSLTLPAGTYRLAVDAAGYGPTIVDGLEVVSGSITIQDVSLATALRCYLPLVRAP
jgi:subtilisin family serine protease